MLAARLNTALATLARLATVVACAALVGLVAVEAWQVFARYVLNDSPGWTEPWALLLMNGAMMFGAAAAVRTSSHFGFFILVESAGPGPQRWLRAITQVIILGIGLLLALWGGELLIDGWNIPMAGAPLPQSAPFLPMAIGGALIGLFGLEQLIAPPARHTES
ncbi:MAG TPA: TRAP transporter small permease subunit [Steroidobacteraceae bacterium]|nr:TRAP transporter small permease subunit [Steroidobacteraceae bacterium]